MNREPSSDYPYIEAFGGAPTAYDPTRHKAVVMLDGKRIGQLSACATIFYGADGGTHGPAMYRDSMRRRALHIVRNDEGALSRASIRLIKR